VPYTEKQKKFFRARAHGFKPSDPKLQGLSQEKAKELSAEADKTATLPPVEDDAKEAGGSSPQKDAIYAMLMHRRNNRD